MMQRAGAIEYEASGEGEPLVLLHGGFFAGAFRPLTREPAVAERYRLAAHSPTRVCRQ